MYKLLSIQQDMITRVVDLKNMKTQTIETCFDDSASVSIDKTFEFMKVGGVYECKLALFGSVRRMNAGDWQEYTIVEDSVIIGNALFVQVQLENDTYYIHQEQVLPYLSSEKLMFECARKDLIQVDGMINEGLYDWII
ncbi:hypothetical protein ACFQH1_08775 [Lactiplantibacillus daoliensis]|uniref:YopX protein domain-containing protein n=1 Tax=Lactiplantibacillus daoliensis TaxID=2559916 RepID=A0ABW1UGR7_9LACO|nr:hypothetical protein [Lactiplantibacillus daoliensis]